MVTQNEILEIVAPLLKNSPFQDQEGAKEFVISSRVNANLKDFLKRIVGTAVSEIETIIPNDLFQDVRVTQCRLSPQAQVIFEVELVPINQPSFLPDFLKASDFKILIFLDPNALTEKSRGGGFEAVLDTNVRLAGFDLEATIDLPGLDLSAHAIFADGQRPTAGELFKEFSVNGGGFETLSLRQISIDGSLQSQDFNFELILDEVFTQDSFLVKDVKLSLSYIGGSDGEITGLIAARAMLGNGTEFDISARYDGANFGWTFNGTVKIDPQDDPVGKILKAFVSDAESPLAGSQTKIDNISVEFNTKSKNFKFDFDGELTLEDGGPNLKMIVSAHLTRQTDGKYEKFFSGRLLIGAELDEIKFDLIFDQAKGVNTFVGVYKNTDGKSVSVQSLLSLANVSDVPQQPVFNIKDALFAYQRGMDDKSRYLFAIDTDFSINLSGLGNVPLVGKALPEGESLDVAFEGLFSTDKIEVKQGSTFRQLLPAGSPFIPDELDPNSRFALLTTVHLGDVTVQVPLGVTELPPAPAGSGSGATGSAGKSTVPATVPAPASNVNWVDVQKHFGPLSIQKVGLSFDRGTNKIGVLLEAELSVSGLTLSVEGLGAVYDLTTKDLTFALSGLGLDFKSGDLEIAGGFLNLDGDFAGKLTIKTKTFSISAFGAVTIVGGEPSIFIYGLLNYPIGGPAFFYVEGLAAGFGYNRSFKMPAIEGVRSFPLVVDAINVGPDKKDATGKSPVVADKAAIAAQLAQLHEFIAPSLGEYFFAFGIKFSSFKLVNSFVLIALVAGKKFEIDLIGVSTYQNPAELTGNLPALARIELNIIGRLAPEEGFLGIQGRLTDNSYVYSNICKISGGFAFFSWFDGPHKGDFVLSVGGYHPSFVKPPHYPDVPRIALTYQITEKVYIKGSAYFALTPSTLMAGAAVEAHAEIGSAEAWFSASIDFIISWEPYHYDARLHVTIGAKWWIFQTEASADVEIWGPPFTGRANVTWTIFSFTVEFGDSAIRGPLPITFGQFENAFIPDRSKVCSVRVVRGVRNTIVRDKQETLVIDTADFVIEVRSTLPALSGVSVTSVNDAAKVTGSQLAKPVGLASFGIAPMNLAEVPQSEIQIMVRKHDGGAATFIDLTQSNFNVVAVEQNFPSGMWGKTLGVATTEGVIPALAGYTISPKAATPSSSQGILRKDFGFAKPEVNEFRPAGGQRLSYTAANGILLDVLRANVTTQRRTELLKSLGIDASGVVRISESLPDSFLKGTQAPSVAVVQQS